jgi:hypothetical protein
MGDYTAVFLPGSITSLQASGTIVGGDLVGVSGSGTVAKITTLASPAYVGVAAHDAAAGQKLAVITGKAVHESIADGTVTAGDLLSSTNTANRQVKTLAVAAVDVGAAFNQATINTAINGSVNNARAVLGVALTTATDNTLVRWVQR